jgi:hypothetical protein
MLNTKIQICKINYENSLLIQKKPNFTFDFFSIYLLIKFNHIHLQKNELKI